MQSKQQSTQGPYYSSRQPRDIATNREITSGRIYFQKSKTVDSTWTTRTARMLRLGLPDDGQGEATTSALEDLHPAAGPKPKQRRQTRAGEGFRLGLRRPKGAFALDGEKGFGAKRRGGEGRPAPPKEYAAVRMGEGQRRRRSTPTALSHSRIQIETNLIN
ncbi:hypothetical protein U1Q18_024755 [Sarracenia purpurea var. burkii]